MVAQLISFLGLTRLLMLACCCVLDLDVEILKLFFGGNWFLKDGSPREDCDRGLIVCNTHLSESSKEEMNEDRESREHKAEQTNPFHL